MTEAEWLANADPGKMLEFLGRCTSARKRRLFAVACCRRIWSILTNERARSWIDTAELLADNLPARCDLERERKDDWEAFQYMDGYRRERINNVQWTSILAAQNAIQDECKLWNSYTPSHYYAALSVAHSRRPNDDVEYDRAKVGEELASQVPLLRDIFGNPFRPVAFDPRWQTADVVALAQGIYDAPAFDRLPILADALMDAGCADESVLEHCRSEGPHVRGCWVVDLVLGKT